MALDCAAREVGVAECSTFSTECSKHSCVVGWRSSTGTDGQEGADNGGPDRQIGKPAKALQGADLTENDSQDSKDQQTDDEAKTVAVLAVVSNRDLRDGTTVVQNQDGNQKEHLKSLENVDGVAHGSAEHTEESLPEIANGIAIRIQFQEGQVDVPTR